MRLAFLILLFANLLLFGWTGGYFTVSEAGREPERLDRQLQPERLRILPATALQAATATPVSTTPDSTTPADAGQACRQIGGLTPAEAEALAKTLSSLPDWRVRVIPQEVPPLHWVVIPGLPNRATAEKKLGELKSLGIEQVQVVEHAVHGPFAISFAMLPAEPAANDLLQDLQRKGVRSARALTLPGSQRSQAELHAPAALLAQKMPDLVALFANATVGECAKP
jgi:hypothetical protein